MTPTVPAEFRDIVALARRQKSVAIRNRHTKGAVLHIIDFERSGRRIVRAGWPTPEGVLATMSVGVPMLGADAVTVAADSYVAAGERGVAEVNPITGKDWRLGDMDEIAEKDMAIERGLISEGISLMRFERSGRWSAGSLAYVHDRARNRLVWGDLEFQTHSDQMKDEALQVGARFPSVAQESFARQTSMDLLDAIGEPDHDVDGFQHRMDVAFARQIKERGGALLEAPF